jgi:hypothetical protein
MAEQEQQPRALVASLEGGVGVAGRLEQVAGLLEERAASAWR